MNPCSLSKGIIEGGLQKSLLLHFLILLMRATTNTAMCTIYYGNYLTWVHKADSESCPGWRNTTSSCFPLAKPLVLLICLVPFSAKVRAAALPSMVHGQTSAIVQENKTHAQTPVPIGPKQATLPAKPPRLHFPSSSP